jgi:tRNA A37 threonylcarbamoyladenosine modification protein TsaB
VVGIDSIEVIAARGRALLGAEAAARALLVAVDARRGSFYCALHGVPGISDAPALLTAVEAAELARAHGALVIGSGAPLVASADGPTIETALHTIEPHARFLAQLAAERAPSGKISPLYLRAPDVKPQRQPIARVP